MPLDWVKTKRLAGMTLLNAEAAGGEQNLRRDSNTDLYMAIAELSKLIRIAALKY